MNAIGNNTGLDAPPASQPNAQEVVPKRSSQLKPRMGAAHTTRIEDILASLPAAAATGTSAQPPHFAVRPDFADQLHAAVGNCATFEDAQAATAAALQQIAAFSFIGWFAAGGSRIGETYRLEGLTVAFDQLSVAQQEACGTASESAVQHSKTAVETVTDDESRVVAAPIRSLPGQCLFAIGKPSRNGVDAAQQAAMELAAARLSEWQTNRQREQAIRDSRHVAALVELLGKLTACPSMAASSQCLTDELQRYLGATEVSLGLCPEHQLKCRLSAVSGTPDVDSFSDSTRLTEAVLQESIARSAASIWPVIDPLNRHSLLSHQHFASEKREVAVVSTPLPGENGHPVGAIVATFDNTEAAGEALSFLHASERAIATTLASSMRTGRTLRSRMAATIRRLLTSAKLKTAVVLCGVVTAALFVPVDYRVTCETELQPVSRRFVAAPFDAPLQDCLVEPGDVVEADQLLAVLDGRELRWELAGVRADLGKATKEHNAHLSEQKFGEAAIARHEIDRLRNQSGLLEDRTKNLEIRSPVAGVIVAGDLKDTEGVPLEAGQSLFEVAPLDRMVVEVAIPEEDIRHIQPGMSIRLRLDAMPSETIEATIQRIHPRAELRDHENVFIAEAELPNSERQLRPGMRGSAKVSTGSRTLGWNLFHKPIAHMAGWLGW